MPIYLREIKLKREIKSQSPFPMSLPIVQNLQNLVFDAPVTFFVGENGSGKSTLLESIAAGMNAITIGSADIQQDVTMRHARELARHIRFVRNRRPKRGFFFRAEDAFGFTKRVIDSAKELDELEQEYDRSLTGSGRLRAAGMARGQRMALEGRYGEDPDAFSHGESFLNVLQTRMVPEGLYIMDEPETPLSPLRQLALMSLIKQKLEDDCQFIIATHSPILMAFPGAKIYAFNKDNISAVDYDDVEHVVLTKAFLNNPEAYLRRL